MKEFTIRKNDADTRLDKFIAKSVPSLPSNLIQKYIRLKRVKVNGARGKADMRLRLGDIVTMYINDEFFLEKRVSFTREDKNTSFPSVIYEDENILLANKPAGLSVHEDSAGGETLIMQICAYLKARGEWNPDEENAFAPALCNRIDRNTEGIVIAAKNAEALRIMNEKIKNRELTKRYLCIVLGEMKPPSGTLKGYIFKDAKENRVYVKPTSSPGAKTAVTKYKTISSTRELSLVECELVTGRTHQIRAQMAASGHPLLGDGKYGKNSENKKYGMKHQALCSYKLSFDFTSPSGILGYLNGKSFEIKNISFKDKFF